MRVALASVVLLAACSSPGMTCEEYGDAVTRIVSDMTIESSQAETLIRQGAQRDFDEAVSAELAAEFGRMAASSDRLSEFDALGAAPDGWLEGSRQVREAVVLQEAAIEELASSFEERDAEILGDAAVKMAEAFEILTQIAGDLPDC